MSILINIICSGDPGIRNQSLGSFCEKASLTELLEESAALEVFRKEETNLYFRVRALFFLYAINRFHIPRFTAGTGALIPSGAVEHLLKRRFGEAIHLLLAVRETHGVSEGVSSALAEAYRQMAFQTLADQVRLSVRSTTGNRWMFRISHPGDQPLSIREQLLTRDAASGVYPALHESTPVRMDITHSGWSDIFFLGMDYPEGARVLNISIDLCIRNTPPGAEPRPPIETWFRVIDEPVIRLTSIDLATTADISHLSEVFDFAKDYLGLLKAAVIASGIVPPGMEGAGLPLSHLLSRLAGEGRGIEIVSKVNEIPRGSRLAVSTNLLASLIALCMRASGQTGSLTGTLSEEERRLVAARAILGEWLGGSGGGWQDSGGIWPGIKIIEGVAAAPGDPEFGISKGRLLPRHTILGPGEVSAATRRLLQDSLVVVHGGMAQDVGPVLEMVTEKYLLRGGKEWQARQNAIAFFDEVVTKLKTGDIRGIAGFTHRNFEGPIQQIIPAASNLYTETIIAKVKREFGDRFWGFWMMGGMSGGGMGFIFDPLIKSVAQERLLLLMKETKRELENAIPFAMEPVVYDFRINENGTVASLGTGVRALMPQEYYTLMLPRLLKRDLQGLNDCQRRELSLLSNAYLAGGDYAGFTSRLFERMIPRSAGEESHRKTLEELLHDLGFHSGQHELIKKELKAGRISLSRNRLPASTLIEDALPSELAPFSGLAPHSELTPSSELAPFSGLAGSGGLDDPELVRLGAEAIRNGEVAIVSLSGGAGSRWSKGAGVVKSLHPFVKMAGTHRSFLEIHLAKTRKTNFDYGADLSHVVTTSYLTHQPVADFLERYASGVLPAGPVQVILSPGSGLRVSPEPVRLAGWGTGAPGTGTSHGAPVPPRKPVQVILSPGKAIGLRLIPMERDLRFLWEEMPQQQLDEQPRKVRESLRQALTGWAKSMGEGEDYRDNLPLQCIHPVGHWYEIANLLLNGTLLRLTSGNPRLQHLLVHNIDTLGAHADAAILGHHIRQKKAMTVEVITRRLDDRGGGLARVNGHLRLVEGVALPDEKMEFQLSYYNTNTFWIHIDSLLAAFGLSRGMLADASLVESQVYKMAARMPAYVIIKEVKKRWGKGQEDLFPVTQFEKLWGDMTALPELPCSYLHVTRMRGQQLKEVAQLDGWLADGSAAYIDSLCRWE